MTPEDKKLEREALLVEYQVCQEAANNETSGYWTFSGVFLAFSSVILAAVITAIFQKFQMILLAFITTFLSLGMWSIYFALFQIMRRANATQRVIFDRMMCIEKRLVTIQMRQNLDTFGAANKGVGENWYRRILMTLSALWLIILVTVWVLVIARIW